MNYYEKLISNRKLFLNQVYNLIINQFREQEKLEKLNNTKEIIQELNSNPDYIQRIFIDAPWGMGKTYFAKALKNKFEEEKTKEIFTGINTSELDDYKKYKKLIKDFKKALSNEKNSKVILIDELDRCKPNYAIELLETVKHFFGVKNIIFIFLVNKDQLKSIVSTSYLTEDKASEYFEKFFDIQFKLPEFEYEDFINSEYSKYNDPETYGVKNNQSDDNTKIYEKIFLDAFTSNCNHSEIAPRTFLKSFKKFKIMLSLLSDEEKKSYSAILFFIFYFINVEFLNTEYTLLQLYKNTFFYSDGKTSRIKKHFRYNEEYYIKFSEFLNKKSVYISFSKDLSLKQLLYNDIVFKNILLFITEYTSVYSNIGNFFMLDFSLNIFSDKT